MRTELRLVLKHVTRGAENIKAVNYLDKPPPPNDECYYAEDTYAVIGDTSKNEENLSLRTTNRLSW